MLVVAECCMIARHYFPLQHSIFCYSIINYYNPWLVSTYCRSPVIQSRLAAVEEPPTMPTLVAH
jgi:hypothetical protein